MYASQRTKRILQITCLVMLLNWLAGTPQSFAQAPNPTNPIYLPLLSRDYDPAWQWQQAQPLILNPTPDPNNPILVSIDPLGRPHLLYATLYEPRFIYHTYATDQGWTDPTPVADTLGTSYTLYPPVVDAQGRLHFVWRNWLGSGVTDPYRLMYARFDQSSWGDEEEVYRSSSEIQGMVRPDQKGSLHITSASSLFGTNIKHFTRTSSGWSSPVDITASHSTSLIWPDYAGGVHLYGRNYYPDESILYAYWHGGKFQMNGKSIWGKLPTGDSVLDGQNNLHLFRQDSVPVPGGTVRGVYHSCLTRDLTLTEERVLSGSQATLSPIVKAEDGHAQVALAWQEGTGNGVQVRIFEDCKPVHSSSIRLPSETQWTLQSASLSSNPGKFCLLARKQYSTTDCVIQCALVRL